MPNSRRYAGRRDGRCEHWDHVQIPIDRGVRDVYIDRLASSSRMLEGAVDNLLRASGRPEKYM